MTEQQKVVKFGKFILRERVPSYEESVECFAAVQEGFDRKVELRVLAATCKEGSIEHARFTKEYRAFSLFDQKNIIKVFDGGTMGNRTYYVIAGREATTFDHILAAGSKAFTAEEILTIGCDLAKAIDHVHEQGHLHLDLGVHSVAYSWEHEFAFLNSFRLGVKSQNLAQPPPNLPADSPLKKTPEVLLGKPLDKRTDFFLLGSLLFHLATLVSPFGDHYMERDARGEHRCLPISPSNISGAVPRQMNKLILKAMAKDPSERFQNADEFISAAERAIRRMSIQDEVSKSAELSASSMRIDPELIKQIRAKKEQKKQEAKKRAILENMPKEESPVAAMMTAFRETLANKPVLGAIPILFLALFMIMSWVMPTGGGHSSGNSGHRRNTKRPTKSGNSGSTSKPVTKKPTKQVGGGRAAAMKKAAGGVAKVYKELRVNSTSKKTFEARWNTLQKWIKRVPQKDRKDKLFNYSKLVQVKLKSFSNPDEAARELDKMYEMAAEYLEIK